MEEAQEIIPKRRFIIIHTTIFELTTQERYMISDD